MKLFITSQLPEQIFNQIPKWLDIDYNNSNIPLTKKDLMEGAKKADIIICPLSDKIDREILEEAKSLKLVLNYGAGYDNIDTDFATKKGLIVTNAPAPSSAISTAELTFGLILASTRRMLEGERDLKEGNFLGWRPTYFLGTQLKGKTLGIIGMGKIGQNLAMRALAFGMEVIYYSRTKKTDMESKGVEYFEFREVLARADILSLHTAYHEDLHHLISREELDIMKEGAYLINAARGPLVDERALIDALKYGKLKGAALDVYEFEPLVSKELMELQNLVMLPHLGNATVEARTEMGQALIDNLKDFLSGKEPRNKIN